MYTLCKYIFYVFSHSLQVKFIWRKRSPKGFLEARYLTVSSYYSHTSRCFPIRLTSDINYKSKDREDDNICIDLSIPHSFCVAAIWMLLDCPHESPKRWGLCQWGWVLLVEVLHGVDTGVVRDLLQPPDRPDQALRDSLCDWSNGWLFVFFLKSFKDLSTGPTISFHGLRAEPTCFAFALYWGSCRTWPDWGCLADGLNGGRADQLQPDQGALKFLARWCRWSSRICQYLVFCQLCKNVWIFLPSFSISSALANWS